MAKSTPKSVDRPAKPSKDYPLTPHPSGWWCKRIGGRLVYIAKWGERVGGKLKVLPNNGQAEQACQLYERNRDHLAAGHKMPSADAPKDLGTVKHLLNAFLTAKAKQVERGELTQRTLDEYREAGEILVAKIDRYRMVASLTPSDFAEVMDHMAAKWGLVRRAKFVQLVRSIFRWGWSNGHIEHPVRFGTEFARPKKSDLRKHAATRRKHFDAAEVRQMLEAATPTLRAMIWLGINCGLGNDDCATLPISAVNLQTGWIDYPRPKTGIGRRCPLWPETVAALSAVIGDRNEGPVFLTERGNDWGRGNGTAICHEFGKLLDRLELQRQGRGFYSLRHTHRTAADRSRDQRAADIIMGHASSHISGQYVEWVEDARLVAVSGTVRAWLFAENPPAEKISKKI